MPLDLETGVGIAFKVEGFDVLLKLPKTLADGAKASDLLGVSVRSLTKDFSGLNLVVSGATDNIIGFARASTSAAGAAQSMGASAAAGSAGVRDIGAAANVAAAQVERLAIAINAIRTMRPGLGDGANGGLAGGGARTFMGGAAPPIALGGRSESLALASGNFASNNFQPGVVRPIPGTGGANGFGAFAGGGGVGGGGGGGAAGGSAGSWWPGPTPANIGASVIHAGIGAAKVGALAAGGLAVDSIYEAGKLQQQLQLVRSGTGATDAQMDKIKQIAFDLSSKTAQSVSQSAAVIGVLASSGINDPKKLTPDFVNKVGLFADLQYLKSGGRVSFEDATKQALQLAHQNQAYTPEAIGKVLEQVSKLSFQMPDSLKLYLTQSNQYAGLFRQLHVPQEEQLMLGTFIDRMGAGHGRGGSGLQNFLLALVNPNKNQYKALSKLGIYGPNGYENPRAFRTDPKTGDSIMDPVGALQAINDQMANDTRHLVGSAKARKEREDVGLLIRAFGISGGRTALMGTPEGVEQLLSIIKQNKTMPSIEAAQAGFMANVFGRTNQATSNFQTLMTEIGWVTLPGVTRGAKDTADALHNAQVWLHQHRDLELRVQKDIVAGVKGTEEFIVGHRKDWVLLRGDIASVYKGAVAAGPALKVVGDTLAALGFVTGGVLGGAADTLRHTANAGKLFMKSMHPRGGPIDDGAAGWNNPAQMATDAITWAIGGRLAGPLEALAKVADIDAQTPKTVNHHYNIKIEVKGPGNPVAIAGAVKSSIAQAARHSASAQGHIVTSPHHAGAETIPIR